MCWPYRWAWICTCDRSCLPEIFLDQQSWVQDPQHIFFVCLWIVGQLLGFFIFVFISFGLWWAGVEALFVDGILKPFSPCFVPCWYFFLFWLFDFCDGNLDLWSDRGCDCFQCWGYFMKALWLFKWKYLIDSIKSFLKYRSNKFQTTFHPQFFWTFKNLAEHHLSMPSKLFWKLYLYLIEFL